jgi:uncharacterized ferritin-like protein (DUF455 family)
MAIVPRGLEARGLDVTPGMIERLRSAGDEVGARILERILEDEIGHVAVGSRWFRHLCAERGLADELTFARLYAEYLPDMRPGVLHRSARHAAGFTDQELAAVERLAKRP